MAYDEGLAQRMRERLDAHAGVVEKKMFGGLAFMLRGNLCCGVMGDDMIVRLADADHEAGLKKPGARVFDFTGKPMKRWLVVDGGSIADDDALAEWVDAGVRFAGSLPPKAPGAAKPKKPAKPKKKRG